MNNKKILIDLMNVYSDGDKISLVDLEDRLISSCEKVKDHPVVIFKQSSLVLNESSSSTVGKRKLSHDSDKPINDKSPTTKKRNTSPSEII